VREAAARLVHFSKESGVPVVLVGHVTKDGSIAGPRLLEHAVDVVLYLEGDVERGLRVLRSLKNRFGATHQVGLFEMKRRRPPVRSRPLGVPDAGWKGEAPGSVVFPSVDGRRPLLVEVQALVSPTVSAQPRRSVRGLEAARVHQVLAVLDRHADFCWPIVTSTCRWSAVCRCGIPAPICRSPSPWCHRSSIGPWDRLRPGAR